MAGAADKSHHGQDVSLSLPWDVIWDWAITLISGGMILTGILFVLAGALGVLRMPDFFTRMHAAGMTDTLGAEFIVFGLCFQTAFVQGDWQMTLKLLLVAFFLFITSPTATHAIANAAHRSGLKPQLGPYEAPSLDAIADEEAS